MPQFPKRYADTVARLRVPSGFLIVVVFAWLSHPDAASLAWGVPVSIAGLALRGWAAGCLYKDSRLATSGPYAHLRNPLYLGTLLVATGLVVASRQPALAAVFAAAFQKIDQSAAQNRRVALEILILNVYQIEMQSRDF